MSQDCWHAAVPCPAQQSLKVQLILWCQAPLSRFRTWTTDTSLPGDQLSQPRADNQFSTKIPVFNQILQNWVNDSSPLRNLLDLSFQEASVQLFLTLIKARSTSCTPLRNPPAQSQSRSRICRGCRSPSVHAIPTFSPEQWLPGPRHTFMLCHAGAGSDPALPGLWLRWDLPATDGSVPRAILSLCKARLPEPCSPNPAGTATPLPLAPTQGNCCESCSQGRARSHPAQIQIDTQHKPSLQALTVPSTQAIENQKTSPGEYFTPHSQGNKLLELPKSG